MRLLINSEGLISNPSACNKTFYFFFATLSPVGGSSLPSGERPRINHGGDDT